MNRLITFQCFKIVQLVQTNNNSVKTVYRLIREDYGQFNRLTEQTIRNVLKKHEYSISKSCISVNWQRCSTYKSSNSRDNPEIYKKIIRNYLEQLLQNIKMMMTIRQILFSIFKEQVDRQIKSLFVCIKLTLQLITKMTKNIL